MLFYSNSERLPHVWESSCSCFGIGYWVDEHVEEDVEPEDRGVKPFQNERSVKDFVFYSLENTLRDLTWGCKLFVEHLLGTEVSCSWVWAIIQFLIHLILSAPTPHFTFLFTSTLDHERPAQAFCAPGRFPGAALYFCQSIFMSPCCLLANTPVYVFKNIFLIMYSRIFSRINVRFTHCNLWKPPFHASKNRYVVLSWFLKDDWQWGSPILVVGC